MNSSTFLLLVRTMLPVVAVTFAAEAKEPGKKTAAKPVTVTVTSKQSLVHLGSIDSFGVTTRGREAASSLYSGLNKKDPESLKASWEVYKKIIPEENFGSEYTGLQWFCEVLTASDEERAKLLANPRHAAFYEFFAKDDFAPLKEYLERQYKLKELPDSGTDTGRDREALLKDTILFNNPRRESWEQSSKTLAILPIKKGMSVADVGSGPGYYSFFFSDMVGPEGKVYALDTVKEHLDYVNAFSAKQKISNVTTVNNSTDSVSLDPASVDLVFMCSLYHIIYTADSEHTKDRFVESIHKALKPGGIFVVADNAMVADDTLPYHGPHIAKELVIGQLGYYGFDLVSTHQFIPQRYVLIFKKRS